MARKSKIVFIKAVFLVGFCIFSIFSTSVQAEPDIHVFINGRQISTDVSAIIVNNRTMVPLRAISEGLGADVKWQDAERRIVISKPGLSQTLVDQPVPIMGESVASSDNLRSLLKKNNPAAPDLVDLYLEIGRDYGVRGDIAFCQAAKETGWWKFGGSVLAKQNNYCGLGATGVPATGDEDLHGANSTRVYYIPGQHGAFFASPADGVEAHIQHLYAYASRKALPEGKTIVDPRFTLVKRGSAPNWSDLNGRWAVPGLGYGQSILNDYFRKALPAGSAISAENGSVLSRGSGKNIQIYINGQEVIPDVPPIIINNRTMVPLRAISEGLGAQVEWQPGTRQVIINSQNS